MKIVIIFFAATLLLVATAVTANEEGLSSREHAKELSQIEQGIRAAKTADEKREASAAKETFLLSKKDQTAFMTEALNKWKSLPGSDRDYGIIRFVWRAFISTDMPGGFWLDQHCNAAGQAGAPHEYVGRSPRVANPLFGNECFRTDSRAYSTDEVARSRLNHPVKIERNKGVSVSMAYSDETFFFICEQPKVFAGARKKCGERICRERSPFTALHTENLHCYDGKQWVPKCSGVLDPDIVYFTLRGKPGDPCTPPGTPKIDYFGRIAIFPKKRHITVNGKTDDYPWVEVVVRVDGNGKFVAQVPPKGNSPWALYGGANNPVVADTPF